MAKKIEFSEVKKALIEGWRAFFPAFIGVVAVQVSAGSGTQDLKMWAKSVAVSAFIAGVRAVAKWLREKYGNQEYEKLIYKLPV